MARWIWKRIALSMFGQSFGFFEVMTGGTTKLEWYWLGSQETQCGNGL
jgi:hypothetical protein